MTFEPTTDMQEVRSILTEPRCWRRMKSDAAPLPEEFEPRVREQLQYVVARHHGRPLGVFVLVSKGELSAEVHFCFTPESWGATTEKAGRAFLRWVWDETSLNWLCGPVPSYNRLALRLARKCGFTDFAVEKRCLAKDGKVYDRILLQIKRPE